MECIKCKRKANLKIEDKSFCNSCFCEIVEKRVRKDIRNQELFSKKDKEAYHKGIKVLIIDDGSENSALNKYMLKKIINNPSISFATKKISSFDAEKEYDAKNEFDKVIIPCNLDDEIVNYMTSLLQNKKAEKVDNRKIKPLVGVTSSEIELFAKIRRLSHKKVKTKNDICIMINSLDEKYPGTKFSILKTIRKIR